MENMAVLSSEQKKEQVEQSLARIADKPGLSAIFPAAWKEQVNEVLSGLEGYHLSQEPEAGGNGEIRVVRDTEKFGMKVDSASAYDTD